MHKYALRVFTSDFENRRTERLARTMYATPNHRRGLGVEKRDIVYFLPTTSRVHLSEAVACVARRFSTRVPAPNADGGGVGKKDDYFTWRVVTSEMDKWKRRKRQKKNIRTPRLLRVWYYNVAVDTWQGWRLVLLLFRNTVTFNAYDTIGRV